MDLTIDVYSTLCTLPEPRFPHQLAPSDEESKRQRLVFLERPLTAEASVVEASEADILCSIHS